MGSQLALWSLSENNSRNGMVQCKVHSTLSLGGDVTATDCKSGEQARVFNSEDKRVIISAVGLLAVGTTALLSVYTLTLQNDIPTWSKKWEVE